VCATDWAPEALRLVAANAHRNGVVVRPLHVDWRAPDAIGDRRFDLVLAADVLYEERNAAPLARLLDGIVAGDGEALVADPGRRHAARFLALVAEGGWNRDTTAAEEVPRGGVHRLWRNRFPTGARP
jgi:predicted nicotinamide N-methyase